MPDTGALTFARHHSTQRIQWLACGSCLGCRKESARQWAVRMMHETQFHKNCAFLTLTYDEKHLPPFGGLDRNAVPAFMKRLRRRLDRKKPRVKVRYFHCGEYGASGSRPHYHVALFGYAFPDRKRWTVREDHEVYRSAELERCWTMGLSEIGSLTFSSSTYIARYVTKKLKINCFSTEEERYAYAVRYERYDADGVVYDVEQEFATMSLRPAIGKRWIETYWPDVYPADAVVMEGTRMRPPRYYDKWMADHEPTIWEKVYATRLDNLDRDENTPERLRMSEMCATAEVDIFSTRSF